MKKLFESGNKAAAGHGRPAGAAEARDFAAKLLDAPMEEETAKLLNMPFGKGLTREVALWLRALLNADPDLSHRALVRLGEWRWGKPRESVDVTSNGESVRYGGSEGMAAIAAMLEGLRLPPAPKAIEAKATKPDDGRPN